MVLSYTPYAAHLAVALVVGALGDGVLEGLELGVEDLCVVYVCACVCACACKTCTLLWS